MKSGTKKIIGAFSLFWAAAVVATAIDWVGLYVFDHDWDTGPDIYPNELLGYPLAFLQLCALAMLVYGITVTVKQAESRREWMVIFTVAVIAAAATFVLYLLFGLAYILNFTDRKL